ncbi:MAG TPA: VOC family protein, partial [Ktedonobacterales bacterium]|nr:VOC family protein [Ktedonobacterales bacterium]
MAVQPEQQASTISIDPAARVGLLSLAVADLERSLAFYTDAFGFTLQGKDGVKATLGVGRTPLLLLTEEPSARPWPHDRY